MSNVMKTITPEKQINITNQLVVSDYTQTP